MKSAFIFFLCFLITLTACKKSVQEPTGPVMASPAHLAELNARLKGTWAYVFWRIDFKGVSGVPGDGSLPVGASLAFDGVAPSASRFDYQAAPLSSEPYKLSGEDGVDYITITKRATDIRKCRIRVLSADSLQLENVLTAKDTSTRLAFSEIWTRSSDKEATDRLFRISINNPYGLVYDPGLTVSVFVTPSGGAEQLVNVQKGITRYYTYSYQPAIGDHVRLAITSSTGGFPFNYVSYDTVPSVLAYYKGVSFGDGWSYQSVAKRAGQNWDIKN